MANKKDHPTFIKLVDFVEGLLNNVDKLKIEGLVAKDPELAEQVRWLHAFQSVNQKLVIENVPADVRESLLKTFRQKQTKTPRASIWQRIGATLTFDSFDSSSTAALVGIRSADTQSQSRQLVYSSMAVDIAIDIFSEQNYHQINGQILPREGNELAAFSVQLMQSTLEAAITTTNAFGEFYIDEIKSGTYEMVLCCEQFDIWLPPLSLDS